MKNNRFLIEFNTKGEKVIAASALSIAGALIFDQKNRKIKHPEKYRGFLNRTARNYRIVDALLKATVAKDLYKKAKPHYKSKTLNNLELQKSEFIDI